MTNTCVIHPVHHTRSPRSSPRKNFVRPLFNAVKNSLQPIMRLLQFPTLTPLPKSRISDLSLREIYFPPAAAEMRLWCLDRAFEIL